MKEQGEPGYLPKSGKSEACHPRPLRRPYHLRSFILPYVGEKWQKARHHIDRPVPHVQNEGGVDRLEGAAEDADRWIPTDWPEGCERECRSGGAPSSRMAHSLNWFMLFAGRVCGP
jgi:hypothetical protein